ncbi:MAG: hypothetical protein KDA24_16285 [Deltaproteobacteria bacterium]|nr:hypothetical protein [Deltaproteobacteria bacterium]
MRAALLLAALLLAPTVAFAQEAAGDEPSADEPSADSAPGDVPGTVWPLDGRRACPSLRACCVPGEDECTHPGMSRLMLGISGGAAFAAGAGTFLWVGDSLHSGDPQSAVLGVGLIGLGGSLVGMIADWMTPGSGGRVHDRPGRPTVRLTVSPGGTSTLDEAAPYGLGIRVDPTIALNARVSLQPHLGVSMGLGNSAHVAPVVGAVSSDQESAFPVVLRTWKMKVTAGAELAVRLPYPLAVKRPMYTGAVEVRWKPMWELRRRTLQPGAANVQIVEHNALYPVNLGLRWHVAPRQRFTFYAGPRIDWLSFSDPGDIELRRGKATMGTFYGEAWWQLDIPFSPLGRRKTSVNGRLNVGYIHSHLDGQRLDVGAIVGYFGPVELSFDLRIRKVNAPVAVQVTAGYRLATGGGPFVELGFVAPELGRKGT